MKCEICDCEAERVRTCIECGSSFCGDCSGYGQMCKVCSDWEDERIEIEFNEAQLKEDSEK